MELFEVKEKLDTLGIPVAYLCFKEPQELPFIAFYEDGTSISGADGYNMYREVTMCVELYSEKKDVALERRIEALFRDAKIEKTTDSYLKNEEMYLTVFSFDTIQYIEEENNET